MGIEVNILIYYLKNTGINLLKIIDIYILKIYDFIIDLKKVIELKEKEENIEIEKRKQPGNKLFKLFYSILYRCLV